VFATKHSKKENQMKKCLLLLVLTMSLQVHAHNDVKAAPKAGEIVWNELATTNVQGAKDFYGKMFGWQFEDKKMDDMTYTIIKMGNKEFGGIWAIPTEQKNQIPPHWLTYILVDNVEKALEAARQNGAKVIKPVQKAGEMGLFAIIQDPVGAHIALWQNLKK
jgi:predicted enzyme related to lactoylglutathione lyase